MVDDIPYAEETSSWAGHRFVSGVPGAGGGKSLGLTLGSRSTAAEVEAGRCVSCGWTP